MTDTSIKTPGGGMVANSQDLIEFARGLEQGSILTKQGHYEMLTAQITASGQTIPYGLGWSLGEVKGKRAYYHTGSQQRVSNVLLVVPEIDFAIAILSNLEGVGVKDLAESLAAETIDNLKP